MKVNEVATKQLCYSRSTKYCNEIVVKIKQ